MKGFEVVSGMPYADARNLKDDAGQPLIQHPIACVDCHDPKTMAVRVTRPGFINGIKALKAKQGIADYDPNRDASRQEMRSFVCGQCHVEYYFKGAGKVVTYPWANGLRVEEIEAYYDAEGFTDFVHAETGDKVLKAQHPEFELWSQGVHARAGVACADCHMPYQRIGAQKVSDHWVRSPLLNLNRACQTCHAVPEAELAGRVLDDPGPPLRAAAAGGEGDHRHAGRHRGRQEGGGVRGRAAGRRGAPPEGAVAARLRGRGELDGLPRAPGDGAHPRRGHRLRAAGPARGRARRTQALASAGVPNAGMVVGATAVLPSLQSQTRQHAPRHFPHQAGHHLDSKTLR